MVTALIGINSDVSLKLMRIQFADNSFTFNISIWDVWPRRWHRWSRDINCAHKAKTFTNNMGLTMLAHTCANHHNIISKAFLSTVININVHHPWLFCSDYSVRIVEDGLQPELISAAVQDRIWLDCSLSKVTVVTGTCWTYSNDYMGCLWLLNLFSVGPTRTGAILFWCYWSGLKKTQATGTVYL